MAVAAVVFMAAVEEVSAAAVAGFLAAGSTPQLAGLLGRDFTAVGSTVNGMAASPAHTMASATGTGAV
jgi:hypothetical protein